MRVARLSIKNFRGIQNATLHFSGHTLLVGGNNVGKSTICEARIARIKEHVFIKEHALDSGVRRFDADPDIVNSWNRLKTGDFVKSDVDLLQHEHFESKFEAIFKTDYRTAHDAAIRSGRTWTPE